ncbi:MAG TPA: toast rack family protein [Candidatus Acidoferrales bacterium]|nr:toast rack family protein [Candidatus Acidoferrales bacterium]
MNTKNLRRKIQGATMLVGAAGLAMPCSGCFFSGFGGSFARTGPVQTETLSIPTGKAKSVRVHLKMGAGEIHVSGGAKNLMEGTIKYNVADWKPDTSYNVDGSDGTLMIMQPEGSHTNGGHVKYDWDLHFTDNTPLDIAVEMGAGESELNLSGLQLENFSLEAGAGNATVDMSGPWKKNVSATFQGGVGSIRLKLPREVGVHVTIEGGLGSVSAPDFKRDGDAYVNDAYGKSPVTLEVHVEGGIGSVNLELAGAEGPA